jgi:hypothetical protein
MALSTFSGPVRSNNGFQIPVVTTANLPASVMLLLVQFTWLATMAQATTNTALLLTQALLGLLL